MEKRFNRQEHPGKCDVCGKEAPVILHRSSFGPFDFHYCKECFRTGAGHTGLQLAQLRCLACGPTM